MMQEIALELEGYLMHYVPLVQNIRETEMASRRSATAWSKKQVLGHLADSAQNNIRRFIVAQYENEPTILYNQDKWVDAAGYQDYDLHNLVSLWLVLNMHLCQVLKTMPAEMAQRQCKTGELHTIEWLASDYIKHFRHHMHQVLNMEAIAYP